MEAVVEDSCAAGDVPDAVVGGQPYIFAEEVLRDGGVDLFEGDGRRNEGLSDPS